MSQRWSSEPLAVHRDENAPLTGAELLFEQLSHDGPSFVVEVFLSADGSPQLADLDVAARFTVFGHGDCWGDLGHCDVPAGPVHEYDRRPPHPLLPRNVTVDVTEALVALGPEVRRVHVTAVADSADEQVAEPMRFSRLTLVTYS